MISFPTSRGVRFQHRVAAVIVHRERVLLHRAAGDRFWSLPGGRVELLEPAAVALRRELREETGSEARVGRLLWVAENFFPGADGPVHEVGFYFAAQLADDDPLLDPDRIHLGDEGGTELRFRWFERRATPQLRIYPSFLRGGLLELPSAPLHLVHEDRTEPLGADPAPPESAPADAPDPSEPV